jgi:hypothetical protein
MFSFVTPRARYAACFQWFSFLIARHPKLGGGGASSGAEYVTRKYFGEQYREKSEFAWQRSEPFVLARRIGYVQILRWCFQGNVKRIK